MIKQLCYSVLVIAVFSCTSNTLRADVISGTISGWPESGAVMQIGDGNNHVSIWWSINTINHGWFYGSVWTSDSDVSAQPGVTDIRQVTDASAFSYTANSVGPLEDADADPDGVGDFVFWRNNNTGYYGALRIDDIIGNGRSATLDGTWYFQTDGSGNFSIPEPSSAIVVVIALIALPMTRRKR